MDITNCPECGKLFKKTSGKICPECMKIEEEQFLEVKNFLDENPHADIEEIEKETGISEKKINKFIREGRLQAAKFENLSAPCISCGRSTKQGKYCNECASNIQDELEKALKDKKEEKDTQKPKEGGKVHIRNRFDSKR